MGLFSGARAPAQEPVRLAPVHNVRGSVLDQVDAVRDAVEDAQGHIFVLDGRSRIGILDRRLTWAGALQPRPGQPAPFRDPAAIDVLADGRLAVLDRARGTVTLFRLTSEGQALTPVDTVVLNQPAEDMCVLASGRMLVYGAEQGRRLHLFDIRGRRIQSFAVADSSIPGPLQDQLATGVIGCDAAAGEVILTSAFTPLVEAFRVSTGAALWADSLRPFRPNTLTIRGNRLSIRTGPAGKSLIRSVMSVGGCRLFQTTYVARQDGQADTVTTYVYGGIPPRLLYVNLTLPRLLPLRDDRFLSLPSATDSLYRVQRLHIDGCHGPTGPSSRRDGPTTVLPGAPGAGGHPTIGRYLGRPPMRP